MTNTIRSEVCVFELATGKTSVVHRSSQLLEAPNWHPDGSWWLLNGGGRLFRLQERRLIPVDTGFAGAINNDHGISPDGGTIVISDATERDHSAIYLLPVHGGTPQPVVTDRAAYWHGWSPDGRELAFVARHDGAFQVHVCPLDGRRPVVLTRGFEHCDGPDYTSDGGWIWFNGTRDGSADLWRMRRDGADLEQMTNDARQNWFPHPSPDGRHIVFLSYAPGVEGHPRDEQVELRLMPADGGPVQTLVTLFGGQGSINVPSWHPDGGRFAFVRYLPVG